jgi:hypothetical protein
MDFNLGGFRKGHFRADFLTPNSLQVSLQVLTHLTPSAHLRAPSGLHAGASVSSGRSITSGLPVIQAQSAVTRLIALLVHPWA